MRNKIARMGMWGNVVFLALGTIVAKFLELKFPEKEGSFGFTGATMLLVGGALLLFPRIPWVIKWAGVAMILESDTVQGMITSGVDTMVQSFMPEATTGADIAL